MAPFARGDGELAIHERCRPSRPAHSKRGFIAKYLHQWLAHAGIQTRFIEPVSLRQLLQPDPLDLRVTSPPA
jgi:hypothetical protein